MWNKNVIKSLDQFYSECIFWRNSSQTTIMDNQTHFGFATYLSQKFMSYCSLKWQILIRVRVTLSLCSRNFQNVKLRLDFVKIWSFYHHSDFAWNHLLVYSYGPKMLILAILEVLNFDFSKFEQLSSTKFTKIQSSEALNLPKMTFLDRLNSPKFDCT